MKKKIEQNLFNLSIDQRGALSGFGNCYSQYNILRTGNANDKIHLGLVHTWSLLNQNISHLKLNCWELEGMNRRRMTQVEEERATSVLMTESKEKQWSQIKFTIHMNIYPLTDPPPLPLPFLLLCHHLQLLRLISVLVPSPLSLPFPLHSPLFLLSPTPLPLWAPPKPVLRKGSSISLLSFTP